MILVTLGTSALLKIRDAAAGAAPGVTWAKQELVSQKLIGWEAAVRKLPLLLLHLQDRHHLHLRLRLQLQLRLALCLASVASLVFWKLSRAKMPLC